MSTAVDVSQNIFIHVVPTQKIPQAKQPEPGNNQTKDFQDYFQNSNQSQVQDKPHNKKQREQPDKSAHQPETTDDYRGPFEPQTEQETDPDRLGHHIDVIA